MTNTPQIFGIISLGIIGGNLGKQAIDKGFQVVGYKRSEWPEDLKQSGIEDAVDYKGFREKLPSPRIVFVYVPAGDAVDKVLDELTQGLEPGDIIVDGEIPIGEIQSAELASCMKKGCILLIVELAEVEQVHATAHALWQEAIKKPSVR